MSNFKIHEKSVKLPDYINVKGIFIEDSNIETSKYTNIKFSKDLESEIFIPNIPTGSSTNNSTKILYSSDGQLVYRSWDGKITILGGSD